MAVYQKNGNIIDYCHKIRKLCQNEFNSRAFSKKLVEILKDLNKIKQSAKYKLSIYILEKSDED